MMSINREAPYQIVVRVCGQDNSGQVFGMTDVNKLHTILLYLLLLLISNQFGKCLIDSKNFHSLSLQVRIALLVVVSVNYLVFLLKDVHLGLVKEKFKK